MNIFYLDDDPQLAAQYHCDKHVSKMIVESAQLLSTAHHVLDGSQLAKSCFYKSTHANHPSAVWVRESIHNYRWLLTMAAELCRVYTARYSRIHKTEAVIDMLHAHQPKCAAFRAGYFCPPPQCMPDKFKQVDTVEAYRDYYYHDKPFAVWHRPNSVTPDWYVRRNPLFQIRPTGV